MYFLLFNLTYWQRLKWMLQRCAQLIKYKHKRAFKSYWKWVGSRIKSPAVLINNNIVFSFDGIHYRCEIKEIAEQYDPKQGTRHWAQASEHFYHFISGTSTLKDRKSTYSCKSSVQLSAGRSVRHKCVSRNLWSDCELGHRFTRPVVSLFSRTNSYKWWKRNAAWYHKRGLRTSVQKNAWSFPAVCAQKALVSLTLFQFHQQWLQPKFRSICNWCYKMHCSLV